MGVFLLGISAWLAGGIVSYGLLLASMQCSFPLVARENRRWDVVFCVLFGLLGGPSGIVIVGLQNGYRYGWRLVPLSASEAAFWQEVKYGKGRRRA